jgi:phosphoribosylaminoimidazole-succinocarboxamide synthase
MTDNTAPIYAGKAKSLYRTGTPGEFLMKFRDDITAFDGGKKDTLGGKGKYNAVVSSYFFQLLDRNGIATHFIRAAGEDSLIVRDLTMIPLEVIVRNVAAGSLVRNFPFQEGALLKPPVIVVDYKDDVRHDPMVNDDIILALGILDRQNLNRLKRLARKINTVLSRDLSKKGIILVDFKLEFGFLGDRILVGDEISMDSMRLWDEKTRESLDKDVYRFDKGDVMATYQSVIHRIIPNKR